MKTESDKKLNMHKFLSIILTFIGIVLLTYMVIVESEPGALPLLLIVVGAGWFFITLFIVSALLFKSVAEEEPSSRVSTEN